MATSGTTVDTAHRDPSAMDALGDRTLVFESKQPPLWRTILIGMLAATGILIGSGFGVVGWTLGAVVIAMGIAERELQRYQIRVSRSAIAMVYKYSAWQKNATYPLDNIASYVDALSPIRGDTGVVGRYLLMNDGTRFHLPLKDVQHGEELNQLLMRLVGHTPYVPEVQRFNYNLRTLIVVGIISGGLTLFALFPVGPYEAETTAAMVATAIALFVFALASLRRVELRRDEIVISTMDAVKAPIVLPIEQIAAYESLTGSAGGTLITLDGKKVTLRKRAVQDFDLLDQQLRSRFPV